MVRMARKTCAGLLVQAQNTGRVLLVQRPEGVWEGPGGHTEPRDGGSLMVTALRELEEETAYKGRLSLWPSTKAVQTGRGDVNYTVFLAVVESEFTPRLTEHREFVWTRASTLPNPTHPGTRYAIDQLLTPTTTRKLTWI